MLIIKNIHGDIIARIDEEDFAYAILSGMDLREADLRGVDLSMASLNFTDLTGADLTGANLSSIGMVM